MEQRRHVFDVHQAARIVQRSWRQFTLRLKAAIHIQAAIGALAHKFAVARVRSSMVHVRAQWRGFIVRTRVKPARQCLAWTDSIVDEDCEACGGVEPTFFDFMRSIDDIGLDSGNDSDGVDERTIIKAPVSAATDAAAEASSLYTCCVTTRDDIISGQCASLSRRLNDGYGVHEMNGSNADNVGKTAPAAVEDAPSNPQDGMSSALDITAGNERSSCASSSAPSHVQQSNYTRRNSDLFRDWGLTVCSSCTMIGHLITRLESGDAQVTRAEQQTLADTQREKQCGRPDGGVVSVY